MEYHVDICGSSRPSKNVKCNIGNRIYERERDVIVCTDVLCPQRNSTNKGFSVTSGKKGLGM